MSKTGDSLKKINPTPILPPERQNQDSKDPQSSTDSQASHDCTRTDSNFVDCVGPQGSYNQKQADSLKIFHPKTTTISARPNPIIINLQLFTSAFPNSYSLLSIQTSHASSLKQIANSNQQGPIVKIISFTPVEISSTTNKNPTTPSLGPSNPIYPPKISNDNPLIPGFSPWTLIVRNHIPPGQAPETTPPKPQSPPQGEPINLKKPYRHNLLSCTVSKEQPCSQPVKGSNDHSQHPSPTRKHSDSPPPPPTVLQERSEEL